MVRRVRVALLAVVWTGCSATQARPDGSAEERVACALRFDPLSPEFRMCFAVSDPARRDPLLADLAMLRRQWRDTPFGPADRAAGLCTILHVDLTRWDGGIQLAGLERDLLPGVG